MIAKKFRFWGRGSIRLVYQKGRTFRAPNFSIRVIKNDRQKNYRLAVVVSKKVSKSAVKRNRIRRRLYEAVRAEQDSIVEPYDMVITVFNESVDELPSGELQDSLNRLLKDAGVVVNKIK